MGTISRTFKVSLLCSLMASPLLLAQLKDLKYLESIKPIRKFKHSHPEWVDNKRIAQLGAAFILAKADQDNSVIVGTKYYDLHKTTVQATAMEVARTALYADSDTDLTAFAKSGALALAREEVIRHGRKYVSMPQCIKERAWLDRTVCAVGRVVVDEIIKKTCQQIDNATNI